jgi:hypothetical protein
MSQQSDPLLKKLDLLAEKIDVLTMVLAAKPNSEQLNNLLRNKKQKEQIRILKEFNLPVEAIALIIGTTLNSARVAVSEMKSETKKESESKKEKPSNTEKAKQE